MIINVYIPKIKNNSCLYKTFLSWEKKINIES